MADDEQKQNIVSDDSCLTTTSGSQVDSKIENIEDSEFIYTESGTTVNDNGHDILQQALKEAETVSEADCLDSTTQIQEVTPVQPVVESAAQNLLNTLTGENDAVQEPEQLKDSNSPESISNIQTTENCVNNVQETLTNENNVDKSGEQTVKPSIVTTVAKHPLGSSQNPIKIVLEGSKFHPSQHLSNEQFQQITQFIQGQQIEKIRESGGSTVVYNASTNTKIIYKVVSPHEAFDKTSLLNAESGVSLLQNSNSVSASNDSSITTPVKRGRGRPRKDGSTSVSSSRGRGRGRKSTSRLEEMDVGKDVPSLTKEELESRKKHRPRTRSGRISKPPSYMVKEYKRIHPLDYHNSEDDIADKPDGGYSDYEVSDSDGEKSNISSNPGNDEGRDENEETVKPTVDLKENEPAKKIVKHRGRPPLSEAERSSKRKTKLRDAMVGCSNEEIKEVFIEQVSKHMSAWDFVLEKSSDDLKINVYEVYRLFDNIFSNIKAHYFSHLHPVITPKENEAFIEITDSNLAEILGVLPGKFILSDKIKFRDTLETCTKRPREDEDIKQEEPDSKKLKLNWSGRYSASGVDLSISEVADEPEAKKSDDKDYPNNVSIIKPDQMQVSIAPVQIESQYTEDSKEAGEVENEVTEPDQNLISFVTDIPEDSNNKSTLPNDVSTSEQPPDQISLLEQPVNNSKTVVSENEMNEIKAISAEEAPVVHIEESEISQENGHQNLTSAVIHTTSEGGNCEEPVTLLVNPETTNEEISNEQTVVGVIEDDGNGVSGTTPLSTENLLGYLGQQLSAEALQPGNIVIIQNGDGTTTTVALSSSDEKEIPMETVHALLAMDQTAQQQIQ